MDISESCLQLNIEEVGSGGGQGVNMDFIIKWIKRKKRKKYIRQLVNDCISFGDFTGTSGTKLDYYIDCRPLVANSTIRIQLIKCLYELIEYNSNLIFAGPQTSGAILACEMALFKNTHSIIITKENKVIKPFGIDLSNKKVILVDDVLTTGSTINKCVELLNMPIKKIIVIVNRRNINKINDIEISSILSYRDLKIG